MKMTSLKEERWRMKIHGCNADGDLDLTRCTLDWWDLKGGLSTHGVIVALSELTERLELGGAISDARGSDEKVVRGHKRFVVSHGARTVELGVISRVFEPDQFTPPLLVLNGQPLIAVLKLAKFIREAYYRNAIAPQVNLTTGGTGVWNVVVRHSVPVANSDWQAPAWFNGVLTGIVPVAQAA